MAAESTAHNYWEKFSGSDAYNDIGFSMGFFEENEHLDYKLWNNGNDQDNEKNFCRTMCAFANTGGGVLIFGVKTKRENGREIGDDLVPIRDVVKKQSGFVQELDSFPILH